MGGGNILPCTLESDGYDDTPEPEPIYAPEPDDDCSQWLCPPLSMGDDWPSAGRCYASRETCEDDEPAHEVDRDIMW